MAISVVMPALEMAQETGKLLAWRKSEGEQVKKGEPLLEIETDKAVVEIEAPGEGILLGITAKIGDEIPVGQTIAWLVKPGEQPPQAQETKPLSGRVSSVAPVVAAVAASTTEQAVSAPQISPKARRLAKELDVDIALLRGTGPNNTISAEDVKEFADRRNGSVTGLKGIARLMAERTTQSWTQVPHFFVSRDIDCTELLRTQKSLATRIEQKHGARLSITDLLVALVARVLIKHPQINASWKDGGIHFNPNVNISVAMAVQDGVVSAVIHNTDTLQLADICVQRQALTKLARENRLRPADITGGTFTISNLGMYQVDSFTAIIPPPQAAILAVGGISERVVAAEGKPAIRPIMTITLSSDHRVIDGARAAEFLRDLVGAVNDPNSSLS